MKILDWVLGRHLANEEEKEQKVGPFAGVSMVGLDALGSSAYGPEALLTVLLPFGLFGLNVALPILGALILLLLIVASSYHQIVKSYPKGGGAYTVARDNLGRRAGLVAASALILDYTLAVAVGLSAGVGAIISAAPSLQPYTLGLALSLLAMIALLNLRGVKESSSTLMVPTYGFVLTLGAVIVGGVVKAILAGGHPVPLERVHELSPTGPTPAALTFYVLARAFASGSTALTGIEAVSNATPAFHEPRVKNANRTLTLLVLILGGFLAGIGALAKLYGIGATEPGQPGFESVISQLTRAVYGTGVFYYLTMLFGVAVLALSANTGFADFPRVCRIVAADGYLPKALGRRGRRLVYSNGILTLTFAAGTLLVIFGGVTDRLIPLFAIGAFLSFTLSQAGMWRHWRRAPERRPWLERLNLAGACLTAATALAALLSHFSQGAWLTLLFMPALYATMRVIKRHRLRLKLELTCPEPLAPEKAAPLLAVVPVKNWNAMTRKSLQFAMQISDEVYAVHAQCDEAGDAEFRGAWARFVEEPLREQGRPLPQLHTLPCPQRRLLGNLTQFVERLTARHPDRKIALVLPHLVEKRWYYGLLHVHRASLLRLNLLFRRHRNVLVVTVPWFVNEADGMSLSA